MEKGVPPFIPINEFADVLMRKNLEGQLTDGLRKTVRADMSRCFEIRSAVRENKLSDTFDEYVGIAGPLIDQGCGWVWDEGGRILGEAGYDPQAGSIEVLYVDPAAEGRGIGSALLKQCCDDLRAIGHTQATLSTTPNTRAESFYRRRGWEEFGVNATGDLLFRKSLVVPLST